MHWFWRATIAVVVGILAEVLIYFVFRGQNTIWWMSVLQCVKGLNPPAWLYTPFLIVTIIAGGSLRMALVTLTSYGILTRYFHPKRAFRGSETRCRKCGYILRGISEPRCSECGERI